jgi:hypothetical protein
LSVALVHTFDLAHQVAADELRLWQLELRDRLGDGLRRAAWIGFGALCLAVAWVAAWAVAVVALEGHFSLEVRLGMLAIAQCGLGAVLVWLGLRRERARAEADLQQRARSNPAAWLAAALVIGLVLGVRR